MKTFYWYKECPFCSEGRLFVYKNLSSNTLYLHCEECERGYYNPERLIPSQSFLSLSENFDAREATKEDIINAGWDKLSLKEVVE